MGFRYDEEDVPMANTTQYIQKESQKKSMQHVSHGAAQVQQAQSAATTVPEMPHDYDAEGTEAVRQWSQRLHEMMSAIPDIDLEAKFGQYKQDVAEQPIRTKMPGTFEGFARGFGSQQGYNSVMKQIGDHKAELQDRDANVLGTEKEILGMKLKKEMADQDADKALKTLQATKELDVKLDDIKSRREAEEEIKKIHALYGEKDKIEQTKGNFVIRKAQERIKALAQAKGLDPNVVYRAYAAQELELLKAQWSKFDPLSQNRGYEIPDLEAMQAQIDRGFSNVINKMTGGNTLPVPEEKPLNKYQRHLKQMREKQ